MGIEVAKRSEKFAKSENSFTLKQSVTPTHIDDEQSVVVDRSVRQLEDFVSALGKNEQLDELARVEALRRMAGIIATQVEELLPEPQPAPFSYSGRPKDHYKMSAFDFYRRYYSQYKSIHLGHIRSMDLSLYKKLMTERRKNAGVFPSDILLKKKSIAMDKRIDKLNGAEKRQILQIAHNIITRQKQGKI